MPKISSLPTANAPTNSDVLAGVQNGVTKKFSLAIIADFLQNLFVPKTNIGVANGVASLDNTGKVPETQLDLSGKQSTITASGILKGDGAGGVSAATPGTDYQAPLTIDATPTLNSTNPVQSGGVYTDVRTRVPNYGKGKNLLRNWYFVNPVNQRGITSRAAAYGAQYFIDGWCTDRTSFSIVSGGITYSTITAGYGFFQKIPSSYLVAGKEYTVSLLSSGALYSFTFTASTSQIVHNLSESYGIEIDYSNGLYDVWFVLRTANVSSTITAVGLELGTEQTLAHQENGTWVLNEIPDYEYELYRCITSTADSYDTFANKTLATEQQLAYVETGTTASRNYSAGEYICWNGLTYIADMAIASGATFYTSGGNKNLTECVGGGFNGLFSTKSYTISITRIVQYSFIEGGYDVTLAGYTPIAVNTFDIDEDHCIIQKLGFISNNINRLYYRIKNYDSSPVTNVTFVVRVLYARASLIRF